MAQSNAAANAVQNLFRTPELKDKILFTLLCLLVYRIGAAVTAPGINPQAITDFIESQSGGGGLLSLYNLFTGGQLARATVFALGIMPYISSSIFVQIAQAVLPQVDKMSKDEEGRKKINQWTRYGTVVLAAVQAWGFSIFAESLPGAVATPGFAFRMQMTFFLTVGAIFVMWLGEQITERGIGNGASLMIFFSIVERIWPGIISAFQFVSTGAVGAFSLLILVVVMVGVVASVVAVARVWRAASASPRVCRAASPTPASPVSQRSRSGGAVSSASVPSEPPSGGWPSSASSAASRTGSSGGNVRQPTAARTRRLAATSR